MKQTITTLLLSLLLVVGAKAQDYTISPESGSVVEEVIDVHVTWESASTITVDANMMMGGIKAYRVENDAREFVTDIFCGPAFGNYILLTMTTPIVDAGDYVIVIPENMITVDGVAWEGTEIEYTIPGVPVSDATIEIVAGEDLSTIDITVSPCEVLSANDDESIEAPFIIRNKGFDSYRAATYTVTITGANTATLTTDKELPAGNYTLHIPKGTFLVDGLLSPFALKDFDTSGVHTVTIDNAPLTVYDLNGVQVIHQGSEGDLKSLQPGIYIVNGEKKCINNSK